MRDLITYLCCTTVDSDGCPVAMDCTVCWNYENMNVLKTSTFFFLECEVVTFSDVSEEYAASIISRVKRKE